MIEYHKTIIFTKTPLAGKFRYKNLFQIYPPELEKMPYSVMQKHHPVVLEYTTTEKDIINPRPEPTEFEALDDLNRRTATAITKEKEILNLLSLFSNHFFFRYDDLTGTWGVPVLNDYPGEEVNEWSAKWILKQFHWPEMSGQLSIDSFKDVEIENVETVEHSNYFFINPNFDYYAQTLITFPNTIIAGIEAYYSLEFEAKGVIDTAISYAIDSMEIRQYKKTLSIICAFTALETMVNYEFREFKPKSCAECNQPQYKVAKKFRDFLLKYISDAVEQRKKFNALYTYRSKIIHTGQKLKTEKLWNNLGDDEVKEELISQVEAIQYGKLSIIQWLLRNRK